MKRGVLLASIVVCAFQWTVEPRPTIGDTSTQDLSAPRAIAIEVLLIGTQGGSTEEYAARLSGPCDEVAACVHDLLSDGRAVSLHRIRLTTLEGQKMLFQLGKDVPVPTGRTFRGPGGPSQTSYNQRSLGTLVSGTAQVVGEKIVLEFQIERSDLVPSPDNSQTEEGFVPSSTEQLTTQTTVGIRSGHTIVVSGVETTTGEESAAQLVLASARLLEKPLSSAAVAQHEAETTQVKIFALENAPADAAATVIRELAAGGSGEFRISVDARTNSLIVSGKKEQVEVVEAILLRLDTSETRGVSQESKEEKLPGFSPPVSKYDTMDKAQLQGELKRLQTEVLAAARTARQAADTASEAERHYRTAPDDERGDALLRKIEADAARHKPDERHKQIRTEWRTAEKAYYRLLIAE